MKAINCIFRETIKEGKFEMKSHILVFLDDNGTEQSAPFTEVRFDGHFDSYQFEGVAYRFMQPMLEAIYNKKKKKTLTNEPTYLQKRYICINNLKR